MFDRSTKVLGLGVSVAVLSLAGCRCEQRKVDIKLGEIAIIYDQDGTTITGPNGTYDFGKVSMGVKKTLKVTIQNRGQGALDLVSMEKLDGADNLKLGDALDQQPPVFTVPFTAITLGAGESIELDSIFDAPLSADPAVKTTEHLVKILLRSSNAAPTAETAEITLKGTAVSGQCTLPAMLDFGAVAIGDDFKQSLKIENLSPIPATASIGSITSNSGDDRAFRFAPESASGEVLITSGASRDVVIAFSPTETKDYLALVKMKAADQCPEVTVKLIGSGVDQVLTCQPNPLDFGYMTPGLTVQRELTLFNQSMAQVNITALIAKVGTALSQEFKVVGPDTVVVPKAERVENPDGSRTLQPGSLKVQIVFQPTLLGPRQGVLTGATTLNKQPMLACPLRGVGGGPDIDVKPSTGLNFGKIPVFATAPKPFYVTRKVTVQNVGTAPNPPDAKANLHLGANNTKPYWRVVPKNTDSLESEICVGVWDEAANPTDPCLHDLPAAGQGSYDPMIGIVAAGTRALLDIPVRITPAAPNKSMEWDVIFPSNDPDEPEVTINVKAQSVILPPCQYQAAPALLNFGLVTPPDYRDLSFSIKNLGQNASDICLITSLDLKPGSDAIFSLPNGPIDQYEMMPGETLNVLVRAWPQGIVGATVMAALGQVQFGISSPIAPQKDIQLQAQIATSCLTIAPDDLDFGTVQKDCNSQRRVFSIYNTCTTGVSITSYGMLAAAGEPAGGPNCPGTTPCPEFLIDGTPGFMPGTVIAPGSSTAVTFALKYHPINYGTDNGAFLIKANQNSQAVDYVVTLRGTGDTMGFNTDVFRQDSKPKADILIVIDDSCSMADKQTALAANFLAFIKYANTANVDYQIGVITTYLNSASEGMLIGDATNPKILRPTTPNVENLFKAKVSVGINGGTEAMAEPAVSALTAPIITNQNAGFLRADAVLAVVGVTDAGDQSPLAATIYENQLRNIKGVQRASMFSYNVIGPFAASPTPGCSYDDFTDPSKHFYLVTRFNGVKEEICTPNWANSLENLGKTAFGYRTNFFLTATPDLTMGRVITVSIDGINLPPIDMRGAPVWNYDTTSNSVNFEALYVPEPGKTLTITYYVTCN